MKSIIALALIIQIIGVNCRTFPFNTVKNTVIRGDVRGLQNMIEEGADVDMVGPDCNKSLLTWATMTGQTGTTKVLLEKGANVNIVDRNTRMTPLMHAAERKQTEIARILVSYQANKDMTDSRGRTAKSIAERNNFIDDMVGIF